MNTKQLTYPSIESQKQFWIDKEAQDFPNLKIGEPWDKTEAKSNNATPETLDALALDATEKCDPKTDGERVAYYNIIFDAILRGIQSFLCNPLHQIPNGNKTTTADPKLEELSRTESLTDWYDHGRNDFDRGDLRDEGRNPNGDGESYAERNV